MQDDPIRIAGGVASKLKLYFFIAAQTVQVT